MIHVFVIAHLAGEHHEVESLIEVAKKKAIQHNVIA